jgi:hypothetical protein
LLRLSASLREHCNPQPMVELTTAIAHGTLTAARSPIKLF